jgi:hypothetical protein
LSLRVCGAVRDFCCRWRRFSAVSAGVDGAAAAAVPPPACGNGESEWNSKVATPLPSGDSVNVALVTLACWKAEYAWALCVTGTIGGSRRGGEPGLAAAPSLVAAAASAPSVGSTPGETCFLCLRAFLMARTVV